MQPIFSAHDPYSRIRRFHRRISRCPQSGGTDPDSLPRYAVVVAMSLESWSAAARCIVMARYSGFWIISRNARFDG